ncbi:MAG: SUMF1/EgtB/PvdO family nonheme iron enzyme [Verrucomicrobiales bacterium]|nr:SUMF1/EgtB/PvdO family nonheme iron enzyme [Verrucomicrobiales bacterium]MDF1826649.1 SUMF1/EgtB/PvdO family nonheme iron enzyme [Verrucomicrobiales bacterium]
MSDPDNPEKHELEIRSSHEIVARMDRQLELVDKLLAERQAKRELFRPSFTNSLGMPFVPVPGLDGVQFCIWQTRVQDYAAYAAENPRIDMAWKAISACQGGPDHPVVCVSWEDATAFCEWLSRKEGKPYRLPTDHEWSVAVGIGDQEDPAASPVDKGHLIKDYPWGNQWPPPAGSGNFAGEETSSRPKIEGYRDPFPFTAPVGSFELNHYGIKDLSGNVGEFCQDGYMSEQYIRVSRGSSWTDHSEGSLRSSIRLGVHRTVRDLFIGFRVVVGVGG